MDPTVAQLEGDQDRASGVLALTWIELSVSMTLVGLRLYTRFVITRHVGWDDASVLAALALLTMISILWTIYAAEGGCRHMYSLAEVQQHFLIKLSWVIGPILIMTVTLSKISASCLIIRSTGHNHPRLRHLLCGVIYACLLFGTINSVMLFFQCSPPNSPWSPTLKMTCLARDKMTEVALWIGILFTIVDGTLVLLPATIAWTIQMPKRQRAALCAVFGLALLATICAAMRLQYLHGENIQEDITWTTMGLNVWSMTEINVIIIATCIPTLQPLFDAVKATYDATAAQRAFSGSDTPRSTRSRRSETHLRWGGIRKTTDVDVEFRPSPVGVDPVHLIETRAFTP